LICRFCQQWNPEEAIRCSFCNNAVQANEDLTRSGRITVEQARLPPVERGEGPRRITDVARALKREPDGYRRDMLRADLVWKIVVGVGIVLYLIWQFGSVFGLTCR